MQCYVCDEKPTRVHTYKGKKFYLCEEHHEALRSVGGDDNKRLARMHELRKAYPVPKDKMTRSEGYEAVPRECTLTSESLCSAPRSLSRKEIQELYGE